MPRPRLPRACTVGRSQILLSAKGITALGCFCRAVMSTGSLQATQSTEARLHSHPRLELGRQPIPQARGKFAAPSAKTRTPQRDLVLALPLPVGPRRTGVQPGTNTRLQAWEPRKGCLPALGSGVGAKMPVVVTDSVEQGQPCSSVRGEHGRISRPISPSTGHLGNSGRGNTLQMPFFHAGRKGWQNGRLCGMTRTETSIKLQFGKHLSIWSCHTTIKGT